MPADSVMDLIEKHAVVPAIVIEDSNQSAPLAQALISGGLPVAEITLRTPGALDAVKRMAAFPGLLVGAGTVMNVAQAEQSVAAGAQFIVSPGTDVSLIKWCLEKQIPIIPGACTPTEVMNAFNAGATCVKFFPSENCGGLEMIRALHGPFPQMKFMPTGGIKLENIGEYLAFKPVIAVGGTWMVKSSWLADDRFDVIEDACRLTVEAVKDARWKINAASRGGEVNVVGRGQKLESRLQRLEVRIQRLEIK